MADVSILGSDSTQKVIVNAVLSEELHLHSNITRYALESGAVASNHRIIEPSTVEIRAAMSNIGGVGPSSTKMSQIEAAFNTDELYTLITQHQVYKNMGFLHVRLVNVAPDGGALQVSLTFRTVPIFGEDVNINVSPDTQKKIDKTNTGSVQIRNLNTNEFNAITKTYGAA